MIEMKAGTAYLKARIEEHQGMQVLRTFGEKLKFEPLSPEQLKTLFASLWAFYREIPSGIVSLALRVNDFWNQRVSPWDAMEKASYLLNASVDEFGLEKMPECFMPTHHQLFLQAAEFYGVSKKELLLAQYILPTAKRMGQLTTQFYREKNLVAGLGFHFASKLTSYPESISFYEGFSTHKDFYQVKSDSDAGLKFFWVHSLVEPKHLCSSIKVVDAFLELKERVMNEIIDGAMAYMDCYSAFFAELQTTLTLKCLSS